MSLRHHSTVNQRRRFSRPLQAYVRADDILLIATHKPMLTARLVNRMVVIQKGEIVADGTPETVIARMRAGQRQRIIEARQQMGAASPRPLVFNGEKKGQTNVI